MQMIGCDWDVQMAYTARKAVLNYFVSFIIYNVVRLRMTERRKLTVS